MNEAKTGELMDAQREARRLAMLPDVQRLRMWAIRIHAAADARVELSTPNIVYGDALVKICEALADVLRWCNEQEKGGGKS